METLVFIKGLIIGFVICAPMGPIGLFCIRKTLLDGRLAGFSAVLGASTVDALYCAIAGLGISFISNFLTNEKTLIRLAGGLILIIVGIKFFFTKPADKTPETKGARPLEFFLLRRPPHADQPSCDHCIFSSLHSARGPRVEMELQLDGRPRFGSFCRIRSLGPPPDHLTQPVPIPVQRKSAHTH